MKKLKTIFASDSGSYLHLGIVLVLALLSLDHLLVAPFFVAEMLYLFSRLRRLFYASLFILALLFISLFVRTRWMTVPEGKTLQGTVVDCEKAVFLLKINASTVLVYPQENIMIPPGTEILVEGSFFKPSGFVIEHRFDYGKYLASEGIQGTFYATRIEQRTTHFHINLLKHEVTQYLLQTFSPAVSGMIIYVLLGNDDWVPEETLESVKTLGISHLFAISGMNIAMIVAFLDMILKRLFLQKNVKEGIIITLLGLYCLLTGFSVSVIRAVAIVVLLFVKAWGKLPFSRLDLMTFSAVALLIWNPFMLYSLSFQLSFLIAFSILIGKEILPAKTEVGSILKISLYANLMALPILLEVSKEFNFISIPANLFFVLFMEKILMPSTFLTAFVPPLSGIYSIIVQGFTSGIEFLSQIKASFFFNFSEVWSKILYYFLLGMIFFRIERKKSIINPLGAMVLLVLLLMTFPNIPQVAFVKVFDVGQGDAIYIHDENADWLIDTGKEDDFDTLLSYFQGENIRHLDYLILTHYHDDHMGEVQDLMQSLEIETVISGTSVKILDFPNLRVVKEGDVIRSGKLVFEVLSADGEFANENNNSLVLYGKVGIHHWLFMGDAEKEVEERLIKQYDLAPDFVKIGHHGSDTSSSLSFIRAISPTGAILSVGEDNAFGHPSLSVLERLSSQGVQVFRTDFCGTLTFSYVWNGNWCLVTQEKRGFFKNEMDGLIGIF